MSIRLELELTEEEKKYLDEAVWYHLAGLASLAEVRELEDYEKYDFAIYKSIYKKLDNKLEDWIEEA
ncbi:hypothetical protein THYS13_15140 [Thermoanaerobacter sp. YS13]|uniref:hypothetical protein n=1 Tax=Thermoanaerobacter sp. YS13 TaxID=1511746 RepID=UPI0005739BD0|nr:hypothetical protein [Thermoanaerobacter sp. YS13]KHO63388.1 hypothetical protein THYS13_15140 [Thermoanaerobacter sp. YS13]